VIEHYFSAREKELLQIRLQEKETKQERKQAVTEGKTVVSSDHLPEDDIERLHLLTTDPAKYEELAKKSGLRG
jgi:penicillin V acylase-like amidase (Ntn superfamily)